MSYEVFGPHGTRGPTFLAPVQTHVRLRTTCEGCNTSSAGKKSEAARNNWQLAVWQAESTRGVTSILA